MATSNVSVVCVRGMELDNKGFPVAPGELAGIVVVGLAIIAFPLYLVQKAVPLIPTSTIAAMTALGPAMVFLMQLFDGRIDYSNATLLGLVIYMAGALLAVHSATSRPNTDTRG